MNSSQHMPFMMTSNQDVRMGVNNLGTNSLPALNDLMFSNHLAVVANAARNQAFQPSILTDHNSSLNLGSLAISSGSTPNGNLASHSSLYSYLQSQLQFQRLQSIGSIDARSQFPHSIPNVQDDCASSARPGCVSQPTRSGASSWNHSSSNASENSAAANKIFPRRKAGQAFRVHSKPVVLTEKVLRQYFDLPLHEAAVQLGISATAMKSACRKCGISKWPYRTVTAKSATANGIVRRSSSGSNLPSPAAAAAAAAPSASRSDSAGSSPSAAPSKTSPLWGYMATSSTAAPPLSPTDVCHAPFSGLRASLRLDALALSSPLFFGTAPSPSDVSSMRRYSEDAASTAATAAPPSPASSSAASEAEASDCDSDGPPAVSTPSEIGRSGSLWAILN